MPADGNVLLCCASPRVDVAIDLASSYSGLMTSSISASRSSNGRNADFIALTVNHCSSSQP